MRIKKPSYEELEQKLAASQIEISRLSKEIQEFKSQILTSEESLHRFLSENDTQNLVLISPEFIILAVSSLARIDSENLYGERFTPGRSFFDFIPQSEHEDYYRLLQEVSAGTPATIENVLTGKDGQTHWMEYNFRPARKLDGKPLGIFSTTREITAQKLAELARQESEERFRLAFQFSPNGMLVCSQPDGLIITTNQSFCQMSGLGAEQLAGKTLREIHLFPNQRELTRYLRILAKRRSIRNIETRLLLAGGQKRTCLLSGSHFPENSQEHFILIVQDIEESIRTEEALRSSEARYKKLADSIEEIFFALDDQMEITYWNQSTETFTGIPAEKALGTPYQELLPELLDDNIRKLAEQALETQHPQRFLSDCTIKNTPYCFEVNIYPSVNGVALLYKDITERQMAARQHQQQLEDLALLSEFSTAFVEITPFEDIYDLIGTHLRHLTGCALAIVNSYDENNCRLTIRSISNNDSMNNHLDGVNGGHWIGASIQLDENTRTTLFNGEIILSGAPCAFRIEQVDLYDTIAENLGLRNPYQVALAYAGRSFGNILMFFEDGKNKFNQQLVKTYANLASAALQRRLAEQALQASEQKFRSFIKRAVEGILLIDENGIILEWNDSQENISGITAQEAINKPLWDIFNSISPPGSKTSLPPKITKTSLLQVFKTGQADWLYNPIETDILTPHGEHKSVQSIFFPIQTENNYLIGGIVHDNTILKQRQREMQTIIEVNKLLRPIASQQDILPELSTRLITLLDLEGIAITLYDATTDENRFTSCAGLWKNCNNRILAPGFGITAQVVRSGEIYLNNNTRNHPDPALTDFHTHSAVSKAIACLPLAANDQVLGAIWVGQSREIGEEELKIFKIIGENITSAMHRSTLYDQLQRRLDHISALRLIDRTIASNLDLKIGLHVLLDQVLAELNVDAADILLINPHIQTIVYGEGRGFRTDLIKRTYLSVGEGLAGRAALEKNVLFLPDLRKATDKFTRRELRLQEDFISYCAAPLIVKGEVKGVLELFTHNLLNPTGEWLEFLENMTGQAAIMIDNSELYSRLQQSNLELRLAYGHTLEGWVRALDLRDEETEGHTQRVMEMTLRLAIRMGMPEDRLVHIQRGALLHDIGKMAVPDSVLLKPGELNESEWEIMHQHPTIAYELLRPIAYLEQALDIPYCHHERWNGSGYPRGLKGEEIPLAARVFAVVDVWDALCFKRPYRSAWVPEKALEYIRLNSGILFDANVVEAFLELVAGDNP